MGDEEVEDVTNLMGDVGSCIADVSVHLSHHTNMLIAIQQRVLVLLHTIASHPMRGLVRLKACIRQHDDQSLGVFVAAGDGHMLLGHQLWKTGRRQRLRLSSCSAASDHDVSHGNVLVERRCDCSAVQVFSASRCVKANDQ